MKKILLASTILAGTAGFAAADNANFTFSGSAYMGMAYSTGYHEGIALDDKNGDGVPTNYGARFRPEISASFTAGMMTTTDMGLEAGASIEVSAAGASFEDDHTDRSFGWYSFDTGGSISDASAYLSGDWGKVTVAYDHNGYTSAGPDGVWASSGPFAADDVSTWDVTVTYDNTWGDFGLSAYYTISAGGAASTNGDAGAKGTYSFGDYSVYAAVDYDNSGNSWSATLGGSASMSGFTLGAEVTYDNGPADWDWMANASYTTGPFTIGAFAEDDGTDDQIDFGANAGYDLGGGVSIDAAYIYDNDQNESLAKLGVSMSF